MDRSLVLRRLCWKEYRQLMPLVVMLAVVALILQSFLLINSSGHQVNSSGHQAASLPLYFFFGLPGLFAAGVGALLVGQEKESKTLYWMASLPVHKQDIIRIKFLAGLVGLVSVWIISFLLLLLSGGLSTDYGRVTLEEIDLPRGVLYSLFLLVLGFATAWSFRSTFVGLLVLVGVAVAYSFGTNLMGYDNIMMILIATTLVSLGVGWYGANRSLSPTPPTRALSLVSQEAMYFKRSIAEQREVQSPWSALVWQFTAQNGVMLLGITAMILAAMVFGCVAIVGISANESRANRLNQTGFDYSSLAIPCVVLGFVAISWLGVVAFQGDNLHQRIRFLADRGVAPKKVWMSRQFVPVWMLILFTVLLLIVATISLIWADVIKNLPNFGFVLLAGIGYMWTIYSVTQWISQVVRSPIIAAILAPMAALVFIAFVAVAWELFETPMWAFAIVTLIPMIATYRMTNAWMDTKIGRRFWMAHAGWLSLILIIPAMPFLVLWATYPSIPSDQWNELSLGAGSVIRNYRTPVELKLLIPRTQKTDEYQEFDSVSQAREAAGGMGEGGGQDEYNFLPEVVSMEEERRLQMNYIESQLKSLDIGDPITGSVVERRLMSEALLVRKRLEDEGIDDALLERYRRAVGALARIIRGVRLVPELLTQQSADQCEAWLLREVKCSGAKERMGPEVWSAAIDQLTDKAGRKNARYRALCGDMFTSFHQIRRPYDANDFKTRMPVKAIRPGPHLGHFSIPMITSGSRLIAQRQVMAVAWRLKQMLEANDAASLQQAKKLIARELSISPSQFGFTPTPLDSVQVDSSPCAYWHGEWEKQAYELRK